MTPNELYEILLAEAKIASPDKELSTLHKAILMECCEHAVENNENLNNETLMVVAATALEVSVAIMAGTVEGALSIGTPAIITYRGVKYRFKKSTLASAEVVPN